MSTTITSRQYLQYLLILVAFHSQHRQHQYTFVQAFVPSKRTRSSSSSPSSSMSTRTVQQHSITHPAASISTTTRNSRKSSSVRWHRRVWSKIVDRRSRNGDGSSSSAATPLQSTATALTYIDDMEQETKLLLDTIALYGTTASTRKQDLDFILTGFEEKIPKQVLPLTFDDDEHDDETVSLPSSSTIDSEFFDVSIIRPTPGSSSTYSGGAVVASAEVQKLSPEATSISNPNNGIKGISLPRLLAMFVENIVSSRIVRHSTEPPEGLDVQVVPVDNTIGRLLTRLQFMADVHISATSALTFPSIRFSKGYLKVEQMTINLMGFLQSRRESSIKYPKQFDIHADGLTMTRNDVAKSSCIRNGLQRLLVRILKDRGIESSSIQITSIDILSSGKISCKGEARTKFGSAPLPFEVRTGLAAESRGHVLVFRGLEVSLARDLGIFVPVLPTVDLDVGHNAVFRRIEIDGIKKEIILDATVTITPDRTLQLLTNYAQASEAFAARFAYDVGRWLTELGKFTR